MKNENRSPVSFHVFSSARWIREKLRSFDVCDASLSSRPFDRCLAHSNTQTLWVSRGVVVGRVDVNSIAREAGAAARRISY